jgi:hypothetical protein
VDVVRRVCGQAFLLVDITTDPELERRFRARIPVVEVDGVARFQYEVDEAELSQLV